jgi:hypothetical protein
MNRLIGLIITIAPLIIGCNGYSSATSTNVPNSVEVTNTIASTDVNNSVDTINKEILLEVQTESAGMVYPLGTILEIKLYSTGEAEMDYYLTTANRIPNTHVPTKALRKKVMLDKSDFQELKTLIEKTDFVKAKSQYSPESTILSDASTSTTINSRYKNDLKKIVLQESDSHLHLEKKKGLYPESLIDLLKLITKIRQKFERT